VAFADAARNYWLDVFPCARAELGHWRQRAGEILDPALRRHAWEAQREKRESVEGAVAFAAFAPQANRETVIRAITAYQVAFDYIDTVSEQPGTDPIANGWRLNQALQHALLPKGPRFDYYAHHSSHEDTGYLQDLVDTCRTALEALPSYGAIAESARRVTNRIVAYQSLNHGDKHGSFEAFARWARYETRSCPGLRWWETGAAAGSPLPIFALIAAAARPSMQRHDAVAVENAYFPWIASLSSLLDSLVDHSEDVACGQRSLIDYYGSPAETATRLQTLASQAACCTKALSDSEDHALILAAMASLYHVSPRASAKEDTRLVTRRILDTVVTDFAVPATLLLRARTAIGTGADAFGAVRGAVQGVVRHANSGIGAFAPQRRLELSPYTTTSAGDVGQISALGEEASGTAPDGGEVRERASASCA
jgi:tetraprenyl-beta-curcumene synthase